ncbi:MAG: DNA primase [Planctomycetota bacterium]|jgi:DNA primase
MPGLFDQTIVNQIQQANDIVDVIAEHISLAKKGREMVGLCPFHDDHRPSLYINCLKQIFKCFACGAGGDVFKFVQMRENLSFPQAIERLAERAGIKVKPVKTARTGAKPNADQVDPNKLAKVNAWAARYFEKNLADKQKGKNARDYLAQRQITPESIKKWHLGLALAQNDLLKAAKTDNVPARLLEQAGLVLSRLDSGFGDKFVNRLMFPITDVTGRVIGFGGRTLDGADAKYINSPATALFDKSSSLYGLEQARHQIVATGQAIVVEGYTDCIMAHIKGCTNVLATLGTSFTSGHGRILRRYAKKVVLVFDGDIAGTEAANRALEVCLAQRIDIKLAAIPQAKDPCDFLLSSGKKAFEQLVDDAVDVFQFKWDRLIENFGGDDTLAGKKAAIEEFLQTVATAVQAGNLPPIDRGLIVNRLSKIIGLGNKQINDELAKRAARAQRAATYQLENRKVATVDLGSGLFAVAQREVLEVLLNEPKLFENVKQKITPELFDVPVLGRIAVVLFETLCSEPKASLAYLLARTESPQAAGLIVQLAESGEKKGNFETRLAGALAAVQRHLMQTKTDIKEIKDETRFLRHRAKNTEKQNPHRLGMT